MKYCACFSLRESDAPELRYSYKLLWGPYPKGVNGANGEKALMSFHAWCQEQDPRFSKKTVVLPLVGNNSGSLIDMGYGVASS